MNYVRYAFQRILLGVALLAVSLGLVFFAMRTLGNPIAIALDSRVSEEEIARRTEEAGLSRPLHEQFFDYVSTALGGSLGETILSGKSITRLVAQHLPATIELGIITLLIALVLGLLFGLLMALRESSRTDKFFRVGTIVFYAVPIFLLGVWLKLAFSIWIPILPVSGRLSVGADIDLKSGSIQTGFVLFDSLASGKFGVFADALAHLALPSLTVGLVVAASFARAVRAIVLPLLSSDWYREALIRSQDKKRALRRHVLKPVAAQLLNAFGIYIVATLTGLVFAERLFEFRGLGYLLTSAIIERDFNLVQGTTLVIAVIVIISNTSTDLIAAAVDPRFRKVLQG